MGKILIENKLLFALITVPLITVYVIIDRRNSMNSYRQYLYMERKIKMSHGMEVENG